MPTFPMLIRRGSATVRIHDYDNNGSSHFMITWNVGAERKRESRSALGAAKARAEEIATSILNGRTAALELTGTDRDSYGHAMRALKPFGIPLHAAIEEWAAAKKTIGPVSLITVADDYAKRHSEKLPPGRIPDLVAKCIEEKRQDGLSHRYVIQLRSDLNRMAAAFPGSVASLTTGELDQWLRGLDVAARTRNNLRTSVTTFFSFCRRHGFLPKNIPTEAEGLSRAKVRDGAIAILRPAQMEALLDAATPAMIPFLALGGFAGLRTAEIQRLHWADVLFDQGWIEIKAEKAKTGSRRLTPISDNLHRWLMPLRQTGLVLPHREIWREITALSGTLGFEWERNVLRHSAISYRVATTQNVNQVALESGNSPAIIFKHYRELVTPADAQKWWGIAPKSESTDGSTHDKDPQENGARKSARKCR